MNMDKSQENEWRERLGRVALVHDFLLYPGGAERVLRAFADMFPEAPIYTLLHDPEGMRGMFRDREVHASFLGKWPGFLRRQHRWLLPFYGAATESVDLRDFDTIISSSGAWMKGLVTRLNTRHIAYLHSPMRYAWDANESYLHGTRGLHFCKRTLLSYLRLWDFEAAARPDVLVANSTYTADRIRKYYRRESQIVYPPVSIIPDDFVPNVEKKFFLTVSRLSAYKHTDMIVRAFSENGLPLVVVGEGREEVKLRRMAGSNVRFLGAVSDARLLELLSHTRAFVFAAEEDFGLAVAESQQAGVPAIALRSGGVMEIVRDGVTGVLFDEATLPAFFRALAKFLEQENLFDADTIRKSAERFSLRKFQEGMVSVLQESFKN